MEKRIPSSFGSTHRVRHGYSIRGVEALKQHRTLQIPFEHTDHEAETCKAERFLEHMNTVRGNRIGTGKGLLKTDILGAFAYFSEDLAKTKVRGKIAASCTTKIQGEISKRRKEIWDALPEYFRMRQKETWDMLPRYLRESCEWPCFRRLCPY